MTESTSEYKKRIEEIKQSIEKEPYMAKMREDIAEGISKTGIRQAAVEEQFQSVLDETTGKDVISAPELIAARNGKSNLKTRLDDEHAQVTAQLQQKADQAEVRLKSVKNELEDMSPTVLAAIEGGEGTSFNLLSIPQDGSVTPEKTNNEIPNTKNSFNLFKLESVVKGKFVSESTGVETSNVSFGYVEIDVTPNSYLFTNINTNGVSQKLAYYDDGGVWVGGPFTGSFAANTAKTKYGIRTNPTATKIKINFLLSQIDNIVIYQDVTKIHTENTLEDKWFNKNIVKKDDALFISNLVEKWDALALTDFGYYGSTGVITTSATIWATAMIPVVEGEIYLVENYLTAETLPTGLGARGIYLDENKVKNGNLFAMNSRAPEYTIPANTKYMIVNYMAAMKDSLSIKRIYTPKEGTKINQSSIFPPIAEGIDASITGEAGKKYKVVAGVMRNTGSGWELISDGDHPSINVNSVTNDAWDILIDYSSIGATGVCSFVVTPDETYAKKGVFCGASVGFTQAKVAISRSMHIGAYINYNGSSWLNSDAYNIISMEWVTDRLVITHSDDTGTSALPHVDKKGYNSLTPIIEETTPTTTTITFINNDGVLQTTPSTDMKFYFTKQGLKQMQPTNLADAGGNLWFYGLFEI